MPSKSNFFLVIFLFSLVLFIPQKSWAQTCTGITSCSAIGMECESICGQCWVCNASGTGCDPSPDFCDNLAGPCQGGECLLNNAGQVASGCVFFSEGLNGLAGLNELCYYCDPGEIVNTCGNGICDQTTEDCNSCPQDCVIPGFAGCSDTTDDPCGPGAAQCEDGDACTVNTCGGAVALSCDAPTPSTCNNSLPDLCCPSNCLGPPAGLTCTQAIQQGLVPRAQCDEDCWPFDSTCGQTGVVVAPDTCDDSVPGANAGVNVTDAQCRDAGTANECTYCGDGIIDSPSEVCDGANAAACNGLGCDANCQCNVTNLCLTGSGGSIDGSLNADCKCSLNKEAVPGGAGDHVLLMGLAAVLGAGLLFRRRRKFRSEV